MAALLAKGAALGTVLAFMMSVIALSLPEDHPAQGAQAAADRHLHGHRRRWHLAGRFRLQRGAVSAVRFQEIFMDIKVLGSGCANCRNTIALIEQVAAEKGVPVTLSKVQEMQDIVSYGVMSTPGVVIDGKVVHAGGVPTRDKIAQWLAA
jgi:small redox-active disulfide protein 2